MTQKSGPATNKNEPQSSPLLAYCLGMTAVTIFGTTLPVTHIALEKYDPYFITFARACIAMIFAFFSLVALRRSLFADNLSVTFVSGFFLIFGFPGLMALGMQTVPAAHGGVVLGFLPLATAMIAKLIADENPSLRFWILSIIGAAVVIGFIIYNASSDERAGTFTGYILLIFAGFCASTGYVLFGKLSRTTPGWEIISRALILNAPISILGLIWFFDPAVNAANTTANIAVIYLGMFSMLIAFFAWNAALGMGGIAKIGQMQLLQVFTTIIAAALLVGEKIDLVTIGAAVLVTAIIFASRK